MAVASMAVRAQEVLSMHTDSEMIPHRVTAPDPEA